MPKAKHTVNSDTVSAQTHMLSVQKTGSLSQPHMGTVQQGHTESKERVVLGCGVTMTSSLCVCFPNFLGLVHCPHVG